MISRILISLLFLCCTLKTAQAQESIGLSLPLTGRLSPVAERIEFGALAAITALKKQGHDLRLVLADDGCDERKAAEVATRFRDENVSIVIGVSCFEIARKLAAALNSQGEEAVPIISLNTRNLLLQRYRENEQLPLYEFSNPPEAEAKAVVEHILPRFGGKPYAVLDDGSVYGRGLADQVRSLGREAGMAPIVSANFRPLQTNQLAVLRRLRRSGVEAVFLAASPEDIVTISGDLQALNYDWAIGTGETARLLPYALNAEAVPEGLMMVRPRDLSAEDSAPLLQSLKDGEVEVEDSLLLGHALVEIAAQALKGETITLENQNFDTVIGPVSFGTDGRAIPSPFELHRWTGTAFEPVRGQ